ncbi:hypothetical protein JXA34_01365 [Patescibacteria group bacterium]|nr:hypothetical protein [Patescibacteria group bacterium]
MWLYKPYLKNAIFTTLVVFLLITISFLIIFSGSQSKKTEFLYARNRVLQDEVNRLGNKFTREEVVCELDDEKAICNINNMRLNCDLKEYTPVDKDQNCCEDQCLTVSSYGMEGYAKLTGYYKPVMIDDGYGLVECSGFVVKAGSVPLIRNSKEKGHVVYDPRGEVVLKITIPAGDNLKEYDRKLLKESNADNQVEIGILKLTSLEKEVGSCYSDYNIVNVRPLTVKE